MLQHAKSEAEKAAGEMDKVHPRKHIDKLLSGKDIFTRLDRTIHSKVILW